MTILHHDRFSGCLFIVQPRKRTGPAGRPASKGRKQESALDARVFINGSFDIVISMHQGRKGLWQHPDHME